VRICFRSSSSLQMALILIFFSKKRVSLRHHTFGQKRTPYTHLFTITTFISSSRMIYIAFLFISTLNHIAFQILANFYINMRYTTFGIHVARCVFVVPSTANLDFFNFASNALQISRLFRSIHFCTFPLLITACFHSLASR